MARLKILMLTRLFPSAAFPTFGTFCMERAKALSEYAEVRVIVPTPYYPDWLPGRQEWKRWSRVEGFGNFGKDIAVIYPRYATIPGTATWFQGVAMASSVRRALESSWNGWRPDAIDGHFAFPDGYAATKLAQVLSVPSVVTCHGSDLRQYPDIPIAGAMTRWTLRNANRVVSVSSDLLQKSMELGCSADRAVFLTNGVDPSKFVIRSQKECRDRLGLPAGRKIGVYVGFLIDRKDQALIIRAQAQIKNLGKPVPLVLLVGDGPNRHQLQEEVFNLGLENDVVFAGAQTHDEVAYWIGAADWLLLSSSSEGWATVYFEAMACGRPVITSNVSSAKDAVKSAEYGAVVEPRTADAFATAMMAAMQCDFDPNVIRAYAEDNSWSKWAQGAMKVFSELVNENSEIGDI